MKKIIAFLAIVAIVIAVWFVVTWYLTAVLYHYGVKFELLPEAMKHVHLFWVVIVLQLLFGGGAKSKS